MAAESIEITPYVFETGKWLIDNIVVPAIGLGGLIIGRFLVKYFKSIDNSLKNHNNVIYGTEVNKGILGTLAIMEIKQNETEKDIAEVKIDIKKIHLELVNKQDCISNHLLTMSTQIGGLDTKIEKIATHIETVNELNKKGK